MYKLSISVLLLIFFASTLVAQANLKYCHLTQSYDNTPLHQVIKSLKGWCQIDIEVDEDVPDDALITASFEDLTIQKALDVIFEESSIGYTIKDDKTIRLIKKSSSRKYIYVTGNYKNIELYKIFKIWEHNYGLTITTGMRELNGIKIRGNLDQEPLDDAFTKVLANTNFDFEFLGEKEIRVFKSINGQKETTSYKKIRKNINVSGVVKDSDSGETLPFATVMVSGTSNGTTTNVDGFFTLLDVPTDTTQLEISYIGYVNGIIKLNPQMALNSLEVFLQPGGSLIDEITISSVKVDQMISASSGISKIGLTPEIASLLPSYGEKDIFRSLQLLPGVSGTNESSSGLFVRGGTPDQNLILFDGFTAYHVDHLFGFFSAFNANAIKDVQLYKGAYESKYGGRLSSVLDITGKDGNVNDFNLGFSASLLSVNGFVESPFADGKGSLLITGRRSFQSKFYSSIFDSFTDIGGDSESENAPQGRFSRFAQAEAQPNSYFYDINAKITYRFSTKDKLSFSLYNGEDDLDNSRIIDSNTFGGGGLFGGGGSSDVNFVNENIDVSNWGNIGGSLKWSRQWTDKFYSNATASYSNYFSKRDRNSTSNITRPDTSFVVRTGSFENNDLRDLSFKLDNELKLNQNNRLDFGFQYSHNDIKYDYIQSDTISLVSRDGQGYTGSFYLQDRITISDKLILAAGLRTNYFSPRSKFYLEPRASATFLFNDNFKLKAAYGKYNQFATRVIREDIQQGSRDFWILADGDTNPIASSTQYVIGGSYETNGFLFDVETYYKEYDGLSEYTNRLESSGAGRNQTLAISEQFFAGTGYSKGIEFLLQKKFGNFTGWASYTLGETKYDFEAFGSEPFFANQDERHELKIVASYRLKNFDFASTFVYGSGKPYTAPVGYYQLTLIDDSVEPYFQISDKNVLRFPAYHRLDFSANYNFDLEEAEAQIGVSLFNVYNKSNTWYNEYEVIDGQLLETEVSLLGLTPSLFFKWSLR